MAKRERETTKEPIWGKAVQTTLGTSSNSGTETATNHPIKKRRRLEYKGVDLDEDTIVRIALLSVPDLKDIGKGALSFLTRDSEYRLCSTIVGSISHMRHAKRTKLKMSDIHSSLRSLKVRPLYGLALDLESLQSGSHGGNEKSVLNPSYLTPYIESNNRRLYRAPQPIFQEGNVMSIKAIINKDLPSPPAPVYVEAHWLAFAGNQPNIPQNQRKQRNGESALTIQENVRRKVGTKCYVAKDVNARLKVSSMHDLSKEHQHYFKIITSVTLEANAKFLDGCFRSISENINITSLLPHLVTFISETIRMTPPKLTVNFAIMRLIRAILTNDKFKLEGHLHNLIPALITCIVRAYGKINTIGIHWVLRDFASSLMQDICNRYIKCKSLKSRIAETVASTLSSGQKPLSSHYGAVLILASLGDKIMDEKLLPRLSTYTNIILRVLNNTKMSKSTNFEATKVLGALVWAVSIRDTGRQYNCRDGDKSNRSNKVSICTEKFLQLVPNAEHILEQLKEKYGEELYPFRGEVSGTNIVLSSEKEEVE